MLQVIGDHNYKSNKNYFVTYADIHYHYVTKKNLRIEISLLVNIYHSHHGWMIYTEVFKVTRTIEGVAK